ncbi:unnamed protein product [Chrysoparadoxa australica]
MRPRPSLFVLSSAGRPIFSLCGDADAQSQVMALIQAILAVCDESGDELRGLEAGSRRFVFLRRGHLTLVGVAAAELETAAHLRLKLELIHAQVLFLLTSKVQGLFINSPSYDLRALLEGMDQSMRKLVETDQPQYRARLQSLGLTTVWMDPVIRHRLTEVLQNAQATVPNLLYVVWVHGQDLVTLAQPKNLNYQLHTLDLFFLAHFAETQPALRCQESWTPVCLPRFNASGYLQAHISFFADPPNTKVGKAGAGTAAGDPGSYLFFITTDTSPEQFHLLMDARVAVESQLKKELGTDWHLFLSGRALKERNKVLRRFSASAKALHFLFRLSEGSSTTKDGGKLPPVSQCISPPFRSAQSSADVQQQIWALYQRGALRLAKGGAQAAGAVGEEGERDGMLSPTAELLEAEAEHSVAYELGEERLGMSVAGNGWTLHACFPASLPVADAFKACSRLARTLQRDIRWLFLASLP